MFQKGVGRLDNWHSGRNWQQWHAGRFEHVGSGIDLARLDYGTLPLFPYLTIHFLWSARNFFCIPNTLALRSAGMLAINKSTMTYKKSLYCSLTWYLITKKKRKNSNSESKQPFCTQTLHFVYDAFSLIWWPLQNLSQCLHLNTLNSLSCMIFCGNGPLIKMLIYYALLQISFQV